MGARYEERMIYRVDEVQKVYAPENPVVSGYFNRIVLNLVSIF